MALDWVPLAEPHRLPAVCGLYLIRHKQSGKEYVGKSVNVRRRAGDHYRARTGVTYLYRAIRKHGLDAFEVCLFATGTEEEMTALEIEVIAARGTFNPAGYNQTRGGDGVSGYRATPEHRAAIVARQTGRPNPPEAIEKMRAWALENNPFRGKKHSPEALEKIAEAGRKRAGIALTGAALEAILAVNARKRGTTHSEDTRDLISRKLKGKKKPEGFGVGVLVGEKNGMHGKRGSKHPRARPVLVWVPGSLTPMTFDSVTEAAAWAGCTSASICDWCAGRHTASNNFAWARP